MDKSWMGKDRLSPEYAKLSMQVFYVQDQLNPKLSIVISTRDKGVNVEEFVDESLVFEGNHTFENTVPAADTFDNNYESQSVLLRNNDGVWIEDITKELNKKTKKNANPTEEDNPLDDESSTEDENSTDDGSSMAGDSDLDYDQFANWKGDIPL